MTGADRIGAALDGLADGEPGAPPRANGELVFAAPWQSRLFATTVSLFDQGRFEWDEFRSRLIEAIAAHTDGLPADDPGDRYDYWGCWLTAFTDLLGSLDLVADAELDLAVEAAAHRPADH